MEPHSLLPKVMDQLLDTVCVVDEQCRLRASSWIHAGRADRQEHQRAGVSRGQGADPGGGRGADNIGGGGLLVRMDGTGKRGLGKY